MLNNNNETAKNRVTSKNDKKRSKTTDKEKELRNKNFKELIGDFNEKELINYRKNTSDISEYIRKNYPEELAPLGPNNIPTIKNNSNFIKNIYYNIEKEFETKKRFCKLKNY